MARIKAFRGIRPRRDLAAEIASPPYDVLDRDEVLALLKRQPKSFMRVIRSDVFFDADTDEKDQRIYDEGRKNLEAMRSEGLLVQDDSPALYLYQQVMGEHSQVGLVAGVSVAEYFAGKIKKHEHTRNKDLDGRIRHIETLGVNAGPVFLTYHKNDAVNALVNKEMAKEPTYDFVAEDEVRHRFWVVSDQQAITELQGAFGEVESLYIADGHHRTEAGCQVGKRQAEKKGVGPDGPENFVMAVIFPHDQVQILAYNRVVHDLNGTTPDELLQALEQHFEVSASDAPVPGRAACFGMYLDGRWYRLTAKAGSFDAKDRQASLDVAILQNNVLGPLLKVEDPKTSQRISFVGGIRGAAELEKRANATGGVAFYCYPTQMEQLMDISDAEEVMPPKSTWFEPKLRSGLIVKALDS